MRFSLAAEYNYNDAKDVVKQMVDLVPAKQQSLIKDLVGRFQSKYGKQVVDQKYFPMIDESKLAEPIKFGDGGILDQFYTVLDDVSADLNSDFTNFEQSTEVSFDDEDTFSELSTNNGLSPSGRPI